MKWEFNTVSYRIKTCFLEQRLDIECDDYDHKDRDANYEIKWLKFTEDQLDCNFTYYNLNEKFSKYLLEGAR